MRNQKHVTFTYRGGGNGKYKMSRMGHLSALIRFETPKQDITRVKVHRAVTSIDNEAFKDWKSLTTIHVPPNVTTIGDRAFYGCSSLTTVELPPTIVSLGNRAFCGCASLKRIEIPTSSSGLGTFQYCTSLESVHFRVDPVLISMSTFLGCHNLTTIRAPSFSTTASNTHPEEFRKALVAGGYSLLDRDLHSLLQRVGPSSSVNYPVPNYYDLQNRNIYYNVRQWARVPSVDDGRLPLCNAALRCHKWTEVERIFEWFMPAVQEVDPVTSLPMFGLAAIGMDGDWETTFRLLRSFPQI